MPLLYFILSFLPVLRRRSFSGRCFSALDFALLFIVLRSSINALSIGIFRLALPCPLRLHLTAVVEWKAQEVETRRFLLFSVRSCFLPFFTAEPLLRYQLTEFL